MDVPTYHVITDIKEDLFNNFKKFTLNDKAHFYTYYYCDDNWVVVTSDQYSSTPKKRYTFPSCVILYIIEESD